VRSAPVLLIVLAWLAVPAAASSSDGFAAFWKEFSVAASKKDKDKIRALTHYPSNELEEKNFDIIWKNTFPRAILACLAKAKPQRDDKAGNYVAFCQDTIYGFERTPQGWRFAWTHPDD
jgi:hypothetical protein